MGGLKESAKELKVDDSRMETEIWSLSGTGAKEMDLQ